MPERGIASAEGSAGCAGLMIAGLVRRGRQGRGHHGIAVDAITAIGGSCGCAWSIRLGTTIRGDGTGCTPAEADEADECGEQNHVQRSYWICHVQRRSTVCT